MLEQQVIQLLEDRHGSVERPRVSEVSRQARRAVAESPYLALALATGVGLAVGRLGLRVVLERALTAGLESMQQQLLRR